MITEASYYAGCVLMAAPIFLAIAIAAWVTHAE